MSSHVFRLKRGLDRSLIQMILFNSPWIIEKLAFWSHNIVYKLLESYESINTQRWECFPKTRGNSTNPLSDSILLFQYLVITITSCRTENIANHLEIGRLSWHWSCMLMYCAGGLELPKRRILRECWGVDIPECSKSFLAVIKSGSKTPSPTILQLL